MYPPYPPKADGSTQFFEGLDASQLLSLEILLSYISAMTDRLEQDAAAEPWPESSLPAATLVDRKARKGVLLQGAAMFNQKPKTGLAFLEKQGIIDYRTETGETDEEKRNKAVAKFLRSSARLDKKLLGDYISRPDQIGLLKAFIGLFDFRGVSHDYLIRRMHADEAEIDRRRDEGAVGDVPAPRRGTADRSNYRDVCRVLLCVWAAWVPAALA